MSVVVGCSFLWAMGADARVILLSIPAVVLLHTVLQPSWKEFFIVSYKILRTVPKAVIEGIEVVFMRGEGYLTMKTKDPIGDTLAVTLSPKSVVVQVDDELHVHEVRMWRS